MRGLYGGHRVREGSYTGRRRESGKGEKRAAEVNGNPLRRCTAYLDHTGTLDARDLCNIIGWESMLAGEPTITQMAVVELPCRSERDMVIN